MEKYTHVRIELSHKELQRLDDMIDVVATELYGTRLSRSQMFRWLLSCAPQKIGGREKHRLCDRYLSYRAAFNWIVATSKSQANPEEYIYQQSEKLRALKNRNKR